MQDPILRRRRQFVTALTRWVSVALGVATPLVSDVSGGRRRFALLAVCTYVAFALVSRWRLARNPRNRRLKIAHDVVDALAIGAVAAFTGGSRSPVALILYPHVVALSVRGGFGYALALGLLDGAVMASLALATPGDPLGLLHALALLACALMGGTVSAHLHQVRRELHDANSELGGKNQQLSATVAANEVARQEQEQAMTLLRDSEERYRRLLERIQDGVLIVQDGRVAYANEVFARMLGETREALTGRPFHELVPPEDRADLLARYLRWEEHGEGLAGLLESHVLTRGGETRLVSLRAGSVEFQGRRSVVTTIRDITRERRMEQDVKAHAERLAAINEIANAVNLSLNMEDILIVAAEEARRLVPFDRLTIALVEEDRGQIDVVSVGRGGERGTASVGRSELAWAFRRPVAWCEGNDHPGPPHFAELLAEPGVRAFASLPLFSKDRVIGALNLGRLEPQPFAAWDLAVMEPVARHIAIALDNARLLEAVRRRSYEFESLLDISRGILERLDLEELLPLATRSVNRVMGTRFCLLLLLRGQELHLGAYEGLEPEVVKGFGTLRLGQSLSGWVAQHGLPLAVPDMGADPRAQFKNVIENYGYRGFLCVPLLHGQEVLGTLEVVTREVRHFTAEEQSLMSAFADQVSVAITNARLYQEARTNLAHVTEANRRLEELDRQRQQYLRNVSHEFRTPLTVIKGYAEYLRDAPLPEEGAVRDVMGILVESSDRVIDMVDTLIEVSRIEQGTAQQTLQIQELDLSELAQSSVDPLRALAERKSVSLELQFPSAEPLRLQGDGGLLQQVVRKLVDNAVKYSATGGHVVVRGRRADGELELEVEDDGIGIPAEHLPRIFDKFYMVDGGITRRAGGSGVGLYLVREIVRLHHGTVEVRSAPGEGSLFRVRVPVDFESARHQPSLA